MAEEKKKKSFLSKLGFKSKDDKRAEEAAKRAEEQKRVDEQMAARMAAINAAALKSARTMDGQGETETSEEDKARQEVEDKRQSEIQAAKDLARAKQLAEERAREQTLKAEREAKAEAAKQKAEAEAKALAEKQAALAAERAEAQRREAEEQAEAEAKRKAEEEAALKAAKNAKEKAALQAKAEAEAKARAEAEAAKKAEAARQEEAARKAAEEDAKKLAEKQAKEAEAERLKQLAEEAREAERRARIAEERATREANEREALAKVEAERRAKLEAEGKLTPQVESAPVRTNFLDRISAGLRKSTSRMSDSMAASFNKRTLDDEALEDLEDILIASDLGTGAAMKVTSRLAESKFDKQITDLEIKIALADVISEILTPLEKPIILGGVKPQIMLFVGVNGSGKTTTLGKIAKRFTDEGKKVLIAAGDTFRAAAFEQLSVWGERANAPVMSGKLGSDAAGLVYDAIDRARREEFDILMIDTAGRLQNRTELMDELSKILRVIKKQDETAPHHSILVLDATVGQNALMQTEAFAKTAEVSGLIMTKLDGTAKGGVLVALSDKYKLPIHCIGIGERIEDLENFSAPVFAAALSGVADEMNE
ncbi:signal recognition particle-docking protein FtsY [Litorimonas sp.]|uniref:signal recognition particle-docking protein FtsY n=1 Tax=Litorimonas sp. TaxID=1892381 RepID=UPI003A884193